VEPDSLNPLVVGPIPTRATILNNRRFPLNHFCRVWPVARTFSAYAAKCEGTLSASSGRQVAAFATSGRLMRYSDVGTRMYCVVVENGLWRVWHWIENLGIEDDATDAPPIVERHDPLLIVVFQHVGIGAHLRSH
jgi:hypothetical protein